MDETVRAIDDLVKQGKVLYWGVSEWKGHQILEAVRVAERLNANPPASNQPQYNMLHRDIEDAVIPVSLENGIGNVVWSPLAQGVLTGKYAPGQPLPEGSRGADTKSNQFMSGMLNDELLTRVQNLKEFANKQGHPLAPFALAWCLRQKAVSSVIVGATSIEQLELNATASGIELDPEVWAQAEAILEGTSGGN